MAALIDKLEKEGSVPLEAYGHQVGGHHLLVKYGKDTICKPLSVKESGFYETISPELRRFTPGYYGVITVSFGIQPSGGLEIMGHPQQLNAPTRVSFSCSAHQSILGGEDKITSKATDGEAYVSPWSSVCEKIAREKLLFLLDDNNPYNAEFVVLENLTSKFAAPSVLDLKVGTRQHGDGVPIEKVVKQTETCANSTSSSLGVRICGMQKYDAAKNEYIFRDKYYGRGLSEDGFRQELKTFLHNGVQFRSDLLTNIILMLEELVRVVERQHSYRFFSSSLLIIYDGAQTLNGHSNGACDPHTSLPELRKHVDIRMIDFGHSTHNGCNDEIKHSGPDNGYLLGLRSMIDIFSQAC